jgi:hypothetical protein
MAWVHVPPTSANPDALIGVAGTLEAMAAEADATGERVSRALYSGAPEFSGMVEPSVVTRSVEHRYLTSSAQRLLADAATVTRAWAADVEEYIARRNQILAARQRSEAVARRSDTPVGPEEIEAVVQDAVDLIQWFEDRARLRARQLSEGPAAAGDTPAGQANAACGSSGAGGFDMADLVGGELSGFAVLPKLSTHLNPLAAGITAGDVYQESLAENAEYSPAEQHFRAVFTGAAAGVGSFAGGNASRLVTAFVSWPAGPLAVFLAAALGAAGSVVGAEAGERWAERMLGHLDHVREEFHEDGASGLLAGVLGMGAAELADDVFGTNSLSHPECIPTPGEHVRDAITDAVEPGIDRIVERAGDAVDWLTDKVAGPAGGDGDGSS